jgi:hypothetical protein
MLLRPVVRRAAAAGARALSGAAPSGVSPVVAALRTGDSLQGVENVEWCVREGRGGVWWGYGGAGPARRRAGERLRKQGAPWLVVAGTRWWWVVVTTG